MTEPCAVHEIRRCTICLPDESPQRSAEWDNAKPGDTLTLDAAYCCDAHSPAGALCTSAIHPAGTRHVATAAGVVEETWGAA